METITPKLAHRLLNAVEKRIGNQIHRKKVCAGAHLMRQGHDPGEMFVLLKGEMRIYYATPKGDEYLLAIAGPGELVGEVEILTGEKNLCSVEVLQDSQVAVFPPDEYREWLKKDPDFALLVNELLCSRLQKISKRAALHLTHPLEYSVLKLVKDLAGQKGTTTLKISKNKIAGYLGTSVRSVNRILKGLHNQGVLTVSKNQIEFVSSAVLDKSLSAYDH